MNISALIKHPYADQHKFGEGPNWRLQYDPRSAGRNWHQRVSAPTWREARSLYLSIRYNSFDILKTGKGRPKLSGLMTVAEVSDLARERWMVPRANSA